MADPFSTAASGLAFAQLAVSITRGVFNVVNEFRVAASYTKDLYEELRIHLDTVSRVEALLLAYGEHASSSAEVDLTGIESALRGLVRSMTQLKELVDRLPKPRDSRFNFRLATKLAVSKQRIERERQQLSNHRNNLAFYITLIGEYNRLKLASRDRAETIRSRPDCHLLPSNQRIISWANISDYRNSSQVLRELSRLYGDIYDCVCQLNGIGLTWRSQSHGSWLLSQYNLLLEDSVARDLGEVAYLGELAIVTETGTRGPTGTRHLLSSEARNASTALGPRKSLIHTKTSRKEQALYVSESHSGTLVVLTKSAAAPEEYCGPGSGKMYGRISYLPGQDQDRRPAITATFQQVGVKIWMSVSSRNIIPNTSPIFHLLQTHDIARVRELLCTGAVCPNDTDEAGNSLLHVRMTRNPSHHPCNFLLESVYVPTY